MQKKRFNLDQYDQQSKVCTSKGYPVRILCTDLKSNIGSIVGIVELPSGEELHTWSYTGRWFVSSENEYRESDYDLFFEPQELECYVILKMIEGVPTPMLVTYDEYDQFLDADPDNQGTKVTFKI